MAKLFNIFSNKKEKTKQKAKIIADYREKNSLVISELARLNIKTEFKHLLVADYLINNIAIERKTIPDFKSSIINKRIMHQLLELKQYPQYFLLLEGMENGDIYSGIIHENAFRGFILSIINEYKVPMIFTLNEKDTAKYLSTLANKKSKSEISIRPNKLLLTEKDRLQFILEGFPQIGPTNAKKLLKRYKTLKDLFNASEEDLRSIIGKKAEIFYKLINLKY